MKPERFAHLNIHSDMSLLEGCATMRQYAAQAHARGHKGISFTERGSLRGISEFIGLAREFDLKQVVGVEVFVCGNMRRRGVTPEDKEAITDGLPRSRWKAAINAYEIENGIHDRQLLTVWARNKEGLQNLFRLTSRSWVEGFYYKPRIDLQELIKLKGGLMVGTGGPGSPIHAPALAGRRKRALEVADILWDEFGPDNLWLEILPHAIYEQAKSNRFTMELKKRWGKKAKLLATQCPHYIKKSDHIFQRMLAAIGDKRPYEDCGLPGEDHWFKTRKEMAEGFASHHGFIPEKAVKRALNNTVRFLDMVEPTMAADRFQYIIPPVYVPPEHDGDEYVYMKRLCLEGWTWRDIPTRIAAYSERHGITYEEADREYRDRLRMELGALKRQNFVVYILFVRELYGWAREQKIACGPGRGSAAGSIVNYLLGITSVDPVEHGLLFERFISPARIDMPDIDMDFEDVRRHEIIAHLKLKYGEPNTSQIATVGKLKGKACIRDVSRVLGVPRAEVGPVTKAILERSSGDERASATIEDSFREFAVCREFNKRHPEVLRFSKGLEGMSRTLGMHAAGVVCAPNPLEDILPLETREHDGVRVPVTAVDFWGAEGFGLLKLDVLGLRTMTVLRMAADEVRRRHGIEIDYEQLELSEVDVLQAFTDHDYSGVFQYDTPGADKVCRGIKFTHFEHIAAGTALNRPGTARSGLASQYVARMKDPKLVAKASYHPSVSKITSDTLGIILYQEHVIKIFVQIAGFQPGTADSLRKKIAKKMGDEVLGKEREKFIKGAVERTGMTAAQAGKIMDAITFFGSYGFNKSHSTAYGMISYWCMYMKVRYPIEFYKALLFCEPKTDKIQNIAKDAKARDIEILPPDVSVSGQGFTIDDEREAIRGSLSDIKGVGKAAATSIMENQPFNSFWDFLERVERRKVNKRVVHALALAGALDELLPNTRWFVENMDTIWNLKDKKTKIDGLKALIAKSGKYPDYDPEERALVASKVSPLAFGKHPVDAYSDFMERSVKVPIAEMGDEDFWERYDSSSVAGFWICGIIIEVRMNQVGDFHSGEPPSESEKARQGWGKQYANVNIEGADGKQHRVKFDWDIFETVRSIVIDGGKGTVVVAHVTGNKQWESLRAHFCIDLEDMRKRVKEGEKLNYWQKVVAGNHPIDRYEFKSQKLKRYANRSLRQIRDEAKAASKKGKGRSVIFRAVGVITHVREKPDKNMNQMGFFGILAKDGYVDALCFSSMWAGIRNHIKPGVLVEIQLEYSRGQGFYSGDKLRLLK